jgi:cell division protein FtsW
MRNPGIQRHDTRFIKRDTSALGRWWWTVDRYLLGATFLLIVIGVLLSFSASPCVAARIGFSRFFFVKRHLLMVPFSVLLLISVSLLSSSNIRKLALLMFIGGIIALIMTYFIGHEVKGAKRWIIFCGLSIQPSEFIKPALSIVVAWLLAERQQNEYFKGIHLSCVIVGITLLLLVAQPDIGMTTIILASFLIQLFIAGMPLFFVFMVVSLGALGFILSYFCIPHVTQRIDSFLHPQLSDPDQMYQIKQSIEAFYHGRWFGCGPGEGVVKRLVPDAHADFVFSVAGEEYGLFLCTIIVILFAFLVIRSIMLSYRDQSLFTVFGVTGIAAQLGLQAFVNMATTLCLIPTKGMTMPFISYGGSSLLAVGIAVGMILSLTRKRYGFVGDL